MNKLTFLFLLVSQILISQSVLVEGYVFESDNRGYMSDVSIIVLREDGSVYKKLLTNREGFFQFAAKSNERLTIEFSKALYNDYKVIQTMPSGKDKHFVNVEMKRAPGYLFEVTIAEEQSIKDETVDALKGYRIDVYNNTKDREEMVWNNYIEPVFSVPLFKENHYTILIRKDGYMSKRIEAFVDIEGCILCFEGLGSVGPGVSETLSEGNQIGVLLANVSLTKAYAGKKMQVKDIYYDLGKWSLKSKSKKELNKLATLMKDNPRWIVELGSHTDARGKDESNLILSNKRAQSAVDYLVNEKNIDRNRISAKGYGESALINKCKDNVECSEAEHLLNRRTEIKIVGMTDKMRYQSLAEIKHSEHMDDILKEIQFGEQVMIPIYDPIQDSILQAKKDSITASLKIDTTVITLDTLKAIVSNDIANKIKNDTIKNNQKKATGTSSPNAEKKTKVEKKQADLKIMTKDIDSQSKTLPEISKDKKVSQGVIVKIVILELEDALEKDNEVFKIHNDVDEMYKQGKFKYLVGDFTSTEEATKFLNESIKMVYPDAYIVKLKK